MSGCPLGAQLRQYDPFGRTVRAQYEYAEENPFRFATKFHDNVSGLVYYGFRFYVPELGRFLNRDPLEERGGWTAFSAARFSGLNPLFGVSREGGHAWLTRWQGRQDRLLGNSSFSHSTDSLHPGSNRDGTDGNVVAANRKSHSAAAGTSGDRSALASSAPNVASQRYAGTHSPAANNRNVPLYAFVGNNPVNAYDAWGLLSKQGNDSMNNEYGSDPKRGQLPSGLIFILRAVTLIRAMEYPRTVSYSTYQIDRD